MQPLLARLLAPRLPFFYGWVVLGCLCLIGFARQGPAVAVVSVFVVPMTDTFGWSRMEMAGAVSLGGVIAAVVSPWLGPVLDRRGARLILSCAVLGAGVATMALSLVQSLLFFYLLLCFARMIWAGPFELGLYGALNNWFVARRPLATSIATLAQMSGLVAIPVIAQVAMRGGDWRSGWIAVGTTVLAVGFLPAFLFLARRPEDLGLLPDPPRGTMKAAPEPRFSRAQAMRTPAFWLLSLYTVLVYPVQAGVSLHQAPHLIERGIPPVLAATVISVFSASSAAASFGIGFLPRHWPLRYAMAGAALLMGVGSFGLIGVPSVEVAYLAAGTFGLGIGGIMTLLPLCWADYFGRESYGAIRSVALSLQVLAQAVGPVLSGALRDWSGDYTDSLLLFGGLAALAVLAALAAKRPQTTPA
ncbi:MAG TPA: MFS transporter [Reyranella sp.]|nr:MFS transporter [Reyranella sp.]